MQLMTTQDLDHAITVMEAAVLMSLSNLDGTIAGDSGYPSLAKSCKTLRKRCATLQALSDAREFGLTANLDEHAKRLTDAHNAVRDWVQDTERDMVTIGDTDAACNRVKQRAQALAAVNHLLHLHRES